MLAMLVKQRILTLYIGLSSGMDWVLALFAASKVFRGWFRQVGRNVMNIRCRVDVI
jgi:hypothetical protein